MKRDQFGSFSFSLFSRILGLLTSKILPSFTIGTDLFQFMFPEMFQMYGIHSITNINFTLYDSPNITFSNTEEDGEVIGVYFPLTLKFN